MKYYLDTCIWRDFYENRFSKKGKHLGKAAAKLFLKIIKNKDKILFSQSLILELEKDYQKDEIYDMLNLLYITGSLIRVEISKEEHLEAKHLTKKRKLPYVDCMNAIQARNNKAILISQDKHLIKDLADITKTVRPERIN